MIAQTDKDVGGRLIAYLRVALGRSELQFASHPAPISGGYDTLIYGFELAGAPPEASGPLILRLFRDEHGRERAPFEAALLDAVVAQAFPAPRSVLAESDPSHLGEAFLVMSRLPGRSMLDWMLGPAILRMPDMLAQLHLRLHALDADAIRRMLEARAQPVNALVWERDFDALRAAVDNLRLDGFLDAVGWLGDNRPVAPDVVVCHGDLHPLNIIVDRGRVAGVIDWTSNIRFACREYDVAATMALLRHGPLSVAALLRPILDFGRRILIAQYVRAYRRRQRLDEGRLRYFEALRSLGFMVEHAEGRLADAGTVERPLKPTAFGDPRTFAQVQRRFAQLTGVSVTLP